MKPITITKVVSSNFIKDWIAKFQNMVGKNLNFYEGMVQKAISQIQQEIKEKDLQIKWYRYETTQLTNGAIMVMFYGEKR